MFSEQDTRTAKIKSAENKIEIIKAFFSSGEIVLQDIEYRKTFRPTEDDLECMEEALIARWEEIKAEALGTGG